MAQIFPPRSNTLAKLSILLVVLVVGGFGLIAAMLYRSPYYTNVDESIEQPVPFSHQHHVGGLGLDCRYCHTSVESSSFAGIPPTNTCMTCHSQVWNTSPMLASVRESFQTNTALQWNRVNSLPDFVYFNHSIHVRQGIGCVTCHGQVDKMPLMRKANSLYMEWCLTCHRAPEKQIRPRSEVFDMNYVPPSNQEQLGLRLVKEYKIHTKQLTDCSICHR
ncbi:MAG: cytochrome c3 family protein [Bacteroidota bacterium]